MIGLDKIGGKFHYEARLMEDGRYGVCRVEWLGEDLTYSDYETAKAVAENIGISDAARISKESMIQVLTEFDGVDELCFTQKGRDNEIMYYARTILCHYMLLSGYTMGYIRNWMKKPSFRASITEERYSIMHGNITYPIFNEMEKVFREKLDIA